MSIQRIGRPGLKKRNFFKGSGIVHIQLEVDNLINKTVAVINADAFNTIVQVSTNATYNVWASVSSRFKWAKRSPTACVMTSELWRDNEFAGFIEKRTEKGTIDGPDCPDIVELYHRIDALIPVNSDVSSSVRRFAYQFDLSNGVGEQTCSQHSTMNFWIELTSGSLVNVFPGRTINNTVYTVEVL